MAKNGLVTAVLLMGLVGCGEHVSAAAEPGQGSSAEQRPAVDHTTLRIRISGARVGPGKLVLVLYDNPESFAKFINPVAWLAVPPQTQTVTLSGIPAGGIAVMAFHDKNENGNYDSGNGLDEGWGASGEVNTWTGPTYESALISANQAHVQMHYPGE